MQKFLHFAGRFGLGTAGLCLCTATCASQTVSLAWNASTNSPVAGYALYYGAVSHQYTTRIDAGTNLMVSVPGLAPGATNYFAVTDYNSAGMQSAFSSEIAFALPVTNSATTTNTNLPAPWQTADIFADRP